MKNYSDESGNFMDNRKQIVAVAVFTFGYMAYYHQMMKKGY
jgi:hypothetical protein